MANNEIRIGINVTGEDQAARDLKKVGAAAEQAGGALADMGERATVAGKSSEKAGGGFRKSADDLDYLKTQAEATEARLKSLVTQLNKTGDRSLVKDIRGEQRELSLLQRLTKLAPDPADGAGMFAGIGKSLVGALSAAKGPATAALVGIALLAAPGIGATVGSAVVGGIGAGGIIGGIALAADDPRVQTAAQGLGATLKAEFGSKGAAEPFVAPLLDSIEIIRASSKDVAGDAREAFATIAPVLRPLTQGIVGLVQNGLPGLTEGFENAKPVLRAVAELGPKLGTHLGDFVKDITRDSDGAVMALHAIVNVTGDVLNGIAETISTLSQMYEWSVKAGAATTGVFEDIFGWVPFVGEELRINNDRFEEQIALLGRAKDASGDYAGNLQVVGESAEEAAAKVKELTDAIDEQFEKTMGVDQATLAYKNGLVDLKKELTDGKRTLLDTSQAGRDNIAAVLDQITAIENLRDANIRNGTAIGTANRQYEAQIEALRKTLLNLGYTKAEVNALIDRYKAIPKSVETTIGIILKTQGSNSAWAALRRAEREEEEHGSTLHAGGRASGGPVTAGKTYWVGEQGPELVTFGADGYVHDATTSRAMSSGTSEGGAWSAGTRGGNAQGGGGDIVGYLEVVHKMPDGEVIRTELLALKRRRRLSSLGF